MAAAGNGNRPAQSETESASSGFVHSTDMMEKELLVAVMAYNWCVPSCSWRSTRQNRCRQLSFTMLQHVLDGYPKSWRP